VDDLLDDPVLDFSLTIGWVGIFVESDHSPTGTLEVLHGFNHFPVVPGKTDRERKKVFSYVGDTIGVDLRTVAFDEEQLEITTAVNVSASIE
jgi:hypothetical protein